jgi:hypothetical protein
VGAVLSAATVGATRRELNDRNRPVGLRGLLPIRRIGGEDTVGEDPEPLALGLVGTAARIRMPPDTYGSASTGSGAAALRRVERRAA